ncbi:SPOSA6832_02087, partial [Sporobolomyces salmonicolor]
MQNRFKDSIWKLGNNPVRRAPLSPSAGEAKQPDHLAEQNYDPAIDLLALAENVQEWYFRDKSTVFLTFRAAVSELPHKLPHYAALLAHLSLKSVEPPVTLASRIAGPASYNGPVSRPAFPLAPGLPPRPVDAAESSLPAKPATEEDATMAEEKNEDETKEREEDKKTEEKQPEKINVGKEIVEDLMKAFQAFLDERKWRSVRYCVILFAQLTLLPPSSPLIASTSLTTLLTSFVSVLDEPGLRAARGDECVRIIVEALLRLEGATEGSGVETLREGVHNYLGARRIERELFADEETKGQWADPLENLVSSLSSSTSDGHFPVTSVLPDPYSTLNISAPSEADELALASASSEEPLYLPMILVPPELDEGDLALTGAIEKAIPPPPTSALFLFPALALRLLTAVPLQTVPSAYDPAGAVIRSLINDIINLYEVNRKEAATVLLELPKWFKKGTFKPSKPAGRRDDDEEVEEEESEGPGWILENMIVESIFNSILALPSPALPIAYYHSLLTELCRLSPSTVAPSLGKCLRKLYASLGNDDTGVPGAPVLDAAGIKRFAEWFSVHLSNFGFMWGWADWAPDMDVSDKHPKRVFVKRTVELEVRLSYYDRVKGTIPEVMLETAIMPDDAPGPEYTYESSGTSSLAHQHTHSAAAASFLRLIRAKAPITEAEEELASFQKSLETEHSMTPEEADKVKRDMAIQTVLHVGSRSFSHFLNALERYLTLLRNLTPTAEKRQDLLNTVAVFWRRNAQFHLIVLDKLLQYRLAEPSDVIAWVFAPQAEGARRKTWSDLDLWGVVAITLRTLDSRVEAGRGRVEGLKREEETREAEKTEGEAAATGEAAQEESSENKVEGDGDVAIKDASNPEITSAISYLSELEAEQNDVLVEIVRQFAKLLPEDVDKDDWETWWTEGWFREFCRVGLTPKVLARSELVEAIEKVEMAPKSAVKAILDATKAIMRALALPLLVLLALPFVAAQLPANAADLPLSRLLSLAQTALASGKTSTALSIYDHCLERDPSDFTTLYKRATIRLASGQYGKAKEGFHEVLAVREYEPAHFQLGKIHVKLGEYQEARKELDHYLKAVKGKEDKEVKEAQELRKQVLAAEKDLAVARKALSSSPPNLDRCISATSSAISLSPHSEELRLLRADCALLAHDFDTTVADLSRASALSPALPTHLQLRIALISSLFLDHGLDIPADSLLALKKCLNADPDSKPCRQAFKALKGTEKELSKLRNWVEAGRWTEAAVMMAGSSTKEGLIPTVRGLIATYQQPVTPSNPATAPLPADPNLPRSSPLLTSLLSTLCHAYIALQNRKSASACAEILLHDPEDTWGLVGKAEVLMKDEKWDEAVQVLSAAFEATGRSDRDVLSRLQKAQRLLKQSKAKDYYKVLGVSRDADAKTIKRAYRKATLKAHPDKEGGSEEKMAALNEAYEVLSNEELRARFDAGEDPNDPTSGQSGFPGGGGGNPVFFQQGGSPFGAGGHPFQQFFQGGGGGFPGGGGGQQYQFRWG